MKRLIPFALTFFLAAGLAFAEGGEGAGSSLQLWKWANFLILAGAIVYLMVKMLPSVFAERTQAITQDMVESRKIREDAEKRAAEVDRRLSGMEAEILQLRVDSQKESQAESERLATRTASEIAKIRTQSERDIADAAKAARTDLKRYAAGLAIHLAEEKIRARMTPAAEDGLVLSFIRDLK